MKTIKPIKLTIQKYIIKQRCTFWLEILLGKYAWMSMIWCKIILIYILTQMCLMWYYCFHSGQYFLESAKIESLYRLKVEITLNVIILWYWNLHIEQWILRIVFWAPYPFNKFRLSIFDRLYNNARFLEWWGCWFGIVMVIIHSYYITLFFSQRGQCFIMEMLTETFSKQFTKSQKQRGNYAILF